MSEWRDRRDPHARWRSTSRVNEELTNYQSKGSDSKIHPTHLFSDGWNCKDCGCRKSALAATRLCPGTMPVEIP